MKTATSDTNALYVSWIDESLPGKVGLTMAPGKRGPGAYAGCLWQRDLTQDLDHLVTEYKTGLLVCLLQDHELSFLQIPTLIEEATKRMKVLRLPIPDGGVLPNAAPVREVVAEIERAARAGLNVVIHCRGGLGRAGTVGGCYLRERGLSNDEVFAALCKRHATKCPEKEPQRAFIRSYVTRSM